MGTEDESTVVELTAVDGSQTALVGGKGAQLGALLRLDGVDAPAGFCVTTAAYRRAVLAAPEVASLVEQLALTPAEAHAAVRDLGTQLRAEIEGVDIPDDVGEAIAAAVERLGVDGAYAVRSSATAEDSAGASFAGQHDTMLGVVGSGAILDAIRRCWASLFTEAAITYRLQGGFEHGGVEMAVVVQRMVAADASGVMFTADPINGDRTVVSIEAVAGLGDALVSGLVTPSGVRVRGRTIEDRTDIDGGSPLSDDQVLRLAALGRRIEGAMGAPQDIEWCLAGDAFAVVQTRPITTLFPVPDAGDDDPHVYVSVGHQQMMTDPMKPLGLSLFQMTAAPRMYEAAGRLFVDVAPRLADRAAREAVVAALGKSDPLIGGALQSVVDRGFVPEQEGAAAGLTPPGGAPPATPLATDAGIVEELIANTEASVEQAAREARAVSGPAAFDFVREDIGTLKRITFEPRNLQVIMAGMEATWWLNDHLGDWLGEKNPADTLALSVPGNVTAEMGLALLDVADAVRPHPEVIAFLDAAAGNAFLDELPALPGGAEVRDAITGFLDRYGVRCVGEIDITRPRWAEHPVALVPAILGNVRNFTQGEGARRFEAGRQQADAKAAELLDRLRALPDGDAKAEETAAMIDRLRTFTGYREFPKFGIVQRYAVWKETLMREVDRLVDEGVLR
ncbi:MAG: phosphoenolpyruvate synthase, partial [Solirubrobacteraceae bacterium]|nr:phosphoenolpyruvate synthase [Patulibacter sp.]